MRVIAVAQNAGGGETVVRNVVFQDTKNRNAQSYTVDLTEIPRGMTRLYVVCNEGSLPSESQTYLLGLAEGTELTSPLETYVVSDGNRSAFPRRRMNVNANTGIPITGYSEWKDLQTWGETITFGIRYMVAKVTVDVTNNRSSSINVNGFNLGPFLPDRAYLFPQTNGTVVPPGTVYTTSTTWMDTDDTQIGSGAKGEGVINFYTYPSASGSYTIGLVLWGEYQFTPIPFYEGTAFDRSTYAILNGYLGDNPQPEFTWQVKPWNTDNGNIIIPPFK